MVLPLTVPPVAEVVFKMFPLKLIIVVLASPPCMRLCEQDTIVFYKAVSWSFFSETSAF